MRDFSLTIYKKLLGEFIQAGYRFITFVEFVQSPDEKEKTIILRHDVDKKPLLSLRTAVLENELQIKGTYYFRVIKNELPRETIGRIAKMGHEIGYHYDDLNDAKGIEGKALELFSKNLAKLREIAPIKTICMHGSPLSKHDNRELWKSHDYLDFGIVGEPYFDIDFNDVMYLTDTGRRWDGGKVNIRDRVRGNGLGVMGKREDRRQKTEDREQKTENMKQKETDSRGAVCDPPALHYEIVDSSKNIGDGRGARGDREERRQKTEDRGQKEEDRRGAVGDPPVFNPHSTGDIIKALKSNMLPDTIMLTIHPQRWTNNYFFWMKELIWQKIKNGVKYFVVKDIR